MSLDRGFEAIDLDHGWTLFKTPAGRVLEPSQLIETEAYADAIVPGTVAQTLRARGYDPVDVHIDAHDWWYHCRMPADLPLDRPSQLCLEGLATLAEIWLEGERIATTSNMYRTYRIALGEALHSKVLYLVFRSVEAHLSVKRSRPRWKTNLVSHQQLRWLRTTLLGRIPGWTPAIAVTGPWRAVRLEIGSCFSSRHARVTGRYREPDRNLLVDVAVDWISGLVAPTEATVTIGGEDYSVPFTLASGVLTIVAELRLPALPLWNPHTHGEPVLHPVVVTVGDSEGRSMQLYEGRVGFREVAVDRSDGNLTVAINGRRVFCRGGCWTVCDFISLTGNDESLRVTLGLIRDSGANMIRVGGTMTYESDQFYRLCDELGILVWQDFMFANMDYPIADEDFRNEVTEEVSEQARRLLTHPSLAVFCGNSEVEQQAAMFGATADKWHSELFYALIPRLLADAGSDLPYFPGSPVEGDLPFHVGTGVSHYFGVGAYRRPVDDVAVAGVRFTSECLGFSNVPDDISLKAHFGGSAPATHQPDWKAGVPRDSAAGWDFEDIRDFYLNALFGVDAVELRSSDRGRYLALSKIVTGEVMQRVFSFWRGHKSGCGGGLVWFLKDIVPGAGWGIIDSDNEPKPAYYFLKRSWRGLNLSLFDVGLDGLRVSLVNETGVAITAEIEVTLLRQARVRVASARAPVEIAARSEARFSVDGLLGRFTDNAYHYRFGAPQHDVVVATLFGRDETVLAQAAWFPQGYSLGVQDKANVQVSVTGDEVTINADVFLQFVHLAARGYAFDDNYFHVAPGIPFRVRARPRAGGATALNGTLVACNVAQVVQIR